MSVFAVAVPILTKDSRLYQQSLGDLIDHSTRAGFVVFLLDLRCRKPPQRADLDRIVRKRGFIEIRYLAFIVGYFLEWNADTKARELRLTVDNNLVACLERSRAAVIAMKRQARGINISVLSVVVEFYPTFLNGNGVYQSAVGEGAIFVVLLTRTATNGRTEIRLDLVYSASAFLGVLREGAGRG